MRRTKDIYSKIKYGKVDESVFFEAALDALEYKKHEAKAFLGVVYTLERLLAKSAKIRLLIPSSFDVLS